MKKNMIILIFVVLFSIVLLHLTSCTNTDNNLINNNDEIDNPENSNVIIHKGIFVGLADNNSFEIIEEKIGFVNYFMIGAKTHIDELEVKTGDKVEIICIYEDNRYLVNDIKIIEKSTNEIYIETEIASYNGLIDNNSFEVTTINNEIMAIRVENSSKIIDDLNIEEGDTITITWYENKIGQNILLWIDLVYI